MITNELCLLGILSEATVVDDYAPKNSKYLTLTKGQKVFILSKGTGMLSDLWFGKVSRRSLFFFIIKF